MKYFGDLLSTTYFEHMTDFRHLSYLKGFSIVTCDLRESETVAWDLNNLKLSHYFVCISHGIVGMQLILCLSFLLVKLVRAFNSCNTLNTVVCKPYINRGCVKD